MSGRKPTDDDLRRRLTPQQYYVTQQRGTETPFTGRFCRHQADGTYCCVCCGAALFDSGTRFESGCGWPSFWQPAAPGSVELLADSSHGMQKTEVRCGSCGAHLGHVFDDGPQPTGQRYCINSAALDFAAESDA